jgi:hypothetical protein
MALSLSLGVAAGPFWTAGRHDRQSSDQAGVLSRMRRTDLIHSETDQRELKARNKGH